MEIAWIPTIIGAVVAWLIGAVWYSERVFGKIFLASQAHRGEEAIRAGALKALVVQMLYTFALAVLIAMLHSAAPATIYALAAVLVLADWAGGMFNGHRARVILVNTSYILVAVVTIALAVRYIPL